MRTCGVAQVPVGSLVQLPGHAPTVPPALIVPPPPAAGPEPPTPPTPGSSALLEQARLEIDQRTANQAAREPMPQSAARSSRALNNRLQWPEPRENGCGSTPGVRGRC